MNVNLLIDNIVRQTTVLVAQLATAAGGQAPLGHVAGQVFVELVRELEAQGLGNKVIADMFGLTLRTFSDQDCVVESAATGCDIQCPAAISGDNDIGGDDTGATPLTGDAGQNPGEGTGESVVPVVPGTVDADCPSWEATGFCSGPVRLSCSNGTCQPRACD